MQGYDSGKRLNRFLRTASISADFEKPSISHIKSEIRLLLSPDKIKNGSSMYFLSFFLFFFSDVEEEIEFQQEY